MKKWRKLEPTDMQNQFQCLKTLYGVGLEAAIDEREALKRTERHRGAVILDKSSKGMGNQQKRS